ncbi:MAG: protoporphyrinogen oxidase [Jatrophihabitantaceae bacterium]
MPGPRVVVVGGGISGLTAAFRVGAGLAQAEVILLEAAPEIGGKLRLASVGGVMLDVGAEAMLARRAEGIELVRELGLQDAVIRPLTTAAHVRAGGLNHPLPARTMLGIPADVDAVRAAGVLSEHALSRIATEPTAAALPPLHDDTAVGTLVRSRLGNEVVDRLVEPLLGGVYAGRADELSLRATMPALAARLGSVGGSLVRAAQAVTDVGSHDPAGGPVFASLIGGLGSLPTALREAGRFAVRTSMTVRAMRRTPTGFALECGPAPEPELIEADAVIVATPAAKAALLLREVAPAAARELREVLSASVAITTLAYRDLRLPAGSGLLVGANEGFGVQAVTLSSQKWPLVTDGLTLLRASVGRAGESHLLQRDDRDLIALVRHELRALIGIHAEPVDALVTRWGGGLPQYAVGHVDRVVRVRAAIAAVAGLGVCGAAYDGVGIPACIASATAAADQVLAALRARREWAL